MKVLEITADQYLRLAELGIPVYATGKGYPVGVSLLEDGGDTAMWDHADREYFASGDPTDSWAFYTLVDSD